MFQKALIIVGIGTLAGAFRACGSGGLKKLGALLVVFVTFLIGFFLSDSLAGGILAASCWLLMPWIELLSRTRSVRFPIDNRLGRDRGPNLQFFPDASAAAHALEDHGFEHASNSAWDWAGMKQYFVTYWHPEECATATVCLCEQDDVAFSFLNLTTRTKDGVLYRTTNFPFATMLKFPNEIRLNHLPCKQKDFAGVLEHHRAFLERSQIGPKELRMPDPEAIDESIEEEMRAQLDHNEQLGVITTHDDGTFTYTKRGLIFLWGQFIKDMIRLC